MDHRAVILDGITIQHVGEVLWESGTTAVVRKQCRRTYLRSLEDFAFAFLFGERLTLSGRMPAVGDDTPGATLIQQRELSEILVTVDMGPPTAIETLLREDDFRSMVRTDIEAAAQLQGSDAEPFCHFFIREAPAYLGDHPSLRQAALGSSSYVFESPGRPSHYVVDRELQALVNPTFTHRMAAVIGQNATISDVSDAALAEFVTRALLTHVANYWAFDRAVEGQPHGSARLPHWTRALVRHKVDSRTNLEPNARLRRLVYRGVVPHALMRVIGVARSKDSFLAALRETRDSNEFAEIRRYLTDLVVSLGTGDRSDADKLIAEIARKTGQGSLQRESFEVSVPVAGGLGVGGGLIDAFQRYWNPGKYYLRKLIQESAYVGGGEYEQRLSRIFPELATTE
jgi:hypothetical protein